MGSTIDIYYEIVNDYATQREFEAAKKAAMKPYEALRPVYADEIMAIAFAGDACQLEPEDIVDLINTYTSAKDPQNLAKYFDDNFRSDLEQEVKHAVHRDLLDKGLELGGGLSRFFNRAKFKPNDPATFPDKVAWWKDQIRLMPLSEEKPTPSFGL